MSANRPIVLAEMLLASVACVALGAGVWLGSHSLSLTMLAGAMSAVLGGARIAWMLWLNRAAVRLLSGETETGPRAVNPFTPLADKARHELGRLNRAQLEAESQLDVVRARMLAQKRSLDRIMSALQTVPHPVLVTDTAGNITQWNRAAIELARELTPSAAEPLNCDFFPGLAELITEARDRQEAAEQWQRTFDWVIDGSSRQYLAAIRNCVEEDRRLGFSITMTDTTLRRDEQSRHAEFVSSVTHEFKTPLACIRAYTEMLQDGLFESPEDQHEACETIQNQVERLTRLVNNLLNLSRIESGVIEVERDDCALQDVLLPQLETVQTAADEKHITLTNSLSDLYLPVHVDRSLMGQAIINLLSNAIKYTPEGGAVELKCRQVDRHGVIEIRDNGLGIPEESLPRLFERFYRVPQNNQAAAGTGLGLTLVHYVVTELHRGTISVESSVGKGTTFRIMLPLGHQSGRPVRSTGVGAQQRRQGQIPHSHTVRAPEPEAVLGKVES